MLPCYVILFVQTPLIMYLPCRWRQSLGKYNSKTLHFYFCKSQKYVFNIYKSCFSYTLLIIFNCVCGKEKNYQLRNNMSPTQFSAYWIFNMSNEKYVKLYKCTVYSHLNNWVCVWFFLGFFNHCVGVKLNYSAVILSILAGLGISSLVFCANRSFFWQKRANRSFALFVKSENSNEFKRGQPFLFFYTNWYDSAS